ncbi:hypothetical protein V6Z11_D09G035300 [Gossypium hirsutum]
MNAFLGHGIDYVVALNQSLNLKTLFSVALLPSKVNEKQLHKLERCMHKATYKLMASTLMRVLNQTC